LSDFFRLQNHIDELSRIGGRDTSVTRLGLSSEEQAARHLVGTWCEARGAKLRRDAAANLYAHFPGERDGDPVLLIGSHLDSVPEGGRFDGAKVVSRLPASFHPGAAPGTDLRFQVERRKLKFFDRETGTRREPVSVP